MQVKEVGVYFRNCPKVVKLLDGYFNNFWTLTSLNASEHTSVVWDQQWQLNRTVPCWSQFVEPHKRCQWVFIPLNGFNCKSVTMLSYINIVNLLRWTAQIFMVHVCADRRSQNIPQHHMYKAIHYYLILPSSRWNWTHQAGEMRAKETHLPMFLCHPQRWVFIAKTSATPLSRSINYDW